MTDPPSLHDAIDALGHYFLGDETLLDTLNRVALATKAALPQSSFVGITMEIDGRPGTYVFTHPEVPEIDRTQYDTGDGPCIESFRSGQVVGIPSTEASDRYHDFCRVAARHGIRSTFSVPLRSPDRTLGAMNLYAESIDAFTATDAEVAHRFATQATFLFVNVQAYWDSVSLSENLHAAMVSRAEIEQAKGIIMGATSCTAEEAFQQLKEQSMRENRKIRDIAVALVARAQRREPRRPG